MTAARARRPSEIGDATMRLVLAPRIGAVVLQRLRAHFGCDEAVVAAGERALREVPGLGPVTAPAIHRALRGIDPSAERARMERGGAGMLLVGDPSYPALLASIPGAPSAVWVRGELRDEDRLAVAVVGSRRCTAYGRAQSERLAGLLAQCGLTIVSGGAVGIDAAAHRGALRAGGRTVAVLGCGLGRCYPPQHDRLYESIVDAGGALLSELPMDAPPLARHFPRRNRIISGLAVGVLVIEAARRSGALITARQAAEEHGREVMVLPGRVDGRAAIGGLEAVRDGWAGLVVDHLDVLRQIDASRHLVRGALESAATGGAPRDEPAFVQRLDAVQGSIVEVLRDLDGEPTPVAQLSARTGLPVQRVLAELTVLQIMGLADRRDDGVVFGGAS